MNSASAIAMSGLFAATQRLNVAAYNIANATDLPADAPADVNAFQPLRADQTEAPGGGTAVTVRAQFPNDALDGVDFASEAIQVVAARYSFAANIAVMRTAAQLQQVLLDTFA
jgi:flagellar basal-body rod protein FlgC